MELEEIEDEEWDTSKYLSKNNARNGGKVRWVLRRGLCLCKKCLVVGFVASAAPVVVPPLVVASAIGIAVCMPCAIFLASHACTQSLMSKLLPIRPTLQDPPSCEGMCYFQPVSDVIYTCKDEQVLAYETEKDIEMVDFQYVKNEENVTTDGPQEETNEVQVQVQVQPRSGDNGVVTMIEEFETPFGVTTIVLEESQDEAMEGDTEEEELQRETKGLVEKIRDEGRTDMTQEKGEYVERICGGESESESDQKIGPVAEDVDVAWEDTHSGIIEGSEEDLRKEEDLNVCEVMLQSINDESNDTICNEVESGEGLLEGKEFDNTNDSQKPMAEPSELLIPDEPIGDLLIEAQIYNILVDEDSSEVISEKIDIHLVVDEESETPPDCPTLLQEGELDNNISDFENQESQLRGINEMVYSSDAEAREIANESELDLFDGKGIYSDEYGYTIDLHEGSSNVHGHTYSMEILVSSVEQESRPSACSSGENIISPSQEVVLDEDNIWKQINVIRNVVGYEGTKQASCADELKALYIFTGVEPPTSLNENRSDPTEIKEKLHFLMSIVGIKSNMD